MGEELGIFTSMDAADKSDHFSCLVANLQQLLRIGNIQKNIQELQYFVEDLC